MRRWLARGYAAVGAVLLLVSAGGCTRSPMTGRLQLALITEQQEIDIGRRTAQEVVRTVGLVDDAELQDYLQSIGERLAGSSERPHLPWSFRVIDEPAPNTFALPGGFIFVTRGLLNLLNSEAELASVLAHEIGHVAARHAATAISRGIPASTGHGLGGALFPQYAALGGLTGAGLELLLLSYSAGAERQADELGFAYAIRQGYDVRELADVLVALQRFDEVDGQGDLPGWLTTHPARADRLDALFPRLAPLDVVAGALRVGRADYLARIDGLVYGGDPRAGIVRDGRFLHADHRFQLAPPADWHVRHLARAMMAVSPQQDAALQVTLTGETSPGSAARRFGRQPAILLGPVLTEDINDLPAAVVEFQAQTRHARLRGIAAFIRDNDRIYQILGYAPAGAHAESQAALREAVHSFGRVVDPQILTLQSHRLQIQGIEEEMTLAEFHSRYPSAVSLPELAMLNGLEDGESVLPAGSQVKRVVGGLASR